MVLYSASQAQTHPTPIILPPSTLNAHPAKRQHRAFKPNLKPCFAGTKEGLMVTIFVLIVSDLMRHVLSGSCATNGWLQIAPAPTPHLERGCCNMLVSLQGPKLEITGPQRAQYSSMNGYAVKYLGSLICFEVYSLIQPYWASVWVDFKSPREL